MKSSPSISAGSIATSPFRSAMVSGRGRKACGAARNRSQDRQAAEPRPRLGAGRCSQPHAAGAGRLARPVDALRRPLDHPFPGGACTKKPSVRTVRRIRPEPICCRRRGAGRLPAPRSLRQGCRYRARPTREGGGSGSHQQQVSLSTGEALIAPSTLGWSYGSRMTATLNSRAAMSSARPVGAVQLR